MSTLCQSHSVIVSELVEVLGLPKRTAALSLTILPADLIRVDAQIYITDKQFEGVLNVFKKYHLKAVEDKEK
jgi:hypothetical protein